MSRATGLALFREKGRKEAGVDEAGRGCLAGPVTAAAVIPGKRGKDWRKWGLDDSKKLGEEARSSLLQRNESAAQAGSVGGATVE